jgi:signal transduction histidine kinase/DNA-binding response OmpR family regulator
VSSRPVLVIEDNPTARKMLRLALESEGYRVIEAADGAAALERMRCDAPGIVLQDLILPDMDGLELTRRLRALPGGATVPILALSGFQSLLDKAASDATIFNEAFVKPIAPSVLVAAIRKYLPPSSVPIATTAAKLPSTPPGEVPPSIAGTHELAEDKSALQSAQLSILAGVAQALAKSQSIDLVLRDVLVSCLDAGGITKGILYRCLRPGTFHPEHAVGFAGTAPQDFADCFGQPSFLAEVLAARTVLPSRLLDAEKARQFLARAGARSLVLLPLLHDGQCAGALLLGSNDTSIGEEDLSIFGRAVAAYVSQALALSRSFARLEATARSNRTLFSSLDLGATLACAARLGTEVADFCEVNLVKDGRVTHWALAHRDAEAEQRAIAIYRKDPPTTGADELSTDVPDSLEGQLGLSSRLETTLVAHGTQLGVMRFCNARGTAFSDGDTAMAEDMARRAAVALDNALLYREAQQANRAKDEFLATVSHELRTPLTGILLWTTRLLKTREPAHLGRGLAAINKCGLLQAKLIDDMLDVSRIVTGKFELPRKLVDVKSVARAAIQVVWPAAESKGVSLDLDFDSTDAVVLGDPERLQQVLWNVLSNAVKFTPPGGHVRASVATVDGCIEVAIRDDGQGIDPQFLPYVFDRFRQADNTMSRKHGGLGLGLSIVRHLVEMHGGTVRAESDGIGCGAHFVIRLPIPCMFADGEGARLSEVRGPDSSDAVVRAPGMRLQGVRVLIVDDEPDFRDLFTEILSDEGALVCSAGSADEGCAMLEQFHPRVLVADLGMPGTDGYDFIRRVRRVSEIPALALTAYAGREHEARALRAGFQMHLAKPVHGGKLLDALTRLLNLPEGARAGSAAAN